MSGTAYEVLAFNILDVKQRQLALKKKRVGRLIRVSGAHDWAFWCHGSGTNMPLVVQCLSQKLLEL